MPIQFPSSQFQPISFQQANPLLSGIQTGQDISKQFTQNAFLPKLLQSTIFSQQFAPLAQIASNPLAMAMMGDKGAGIMNMISQLLGQTGSAGNNGGLLSKLFGGNQNTQVPSGGTGGPFGSSAPGANTPNPTMSNAEVTQLSNQRANTMGNGNPLLPAAGQGIQAGAVAKALGPTQSQTQAPGTLYSTPTGDNTYSTPTGGQVDQAQKTMTAYQNLKQLVPQLLEQSKQFENKSLDINKSKAAQTLKSYHLGKISDLFSNDPELAGNWNNFNQNVNRAGIVLKGIYPSSGAQESYNQHMAMLAFDPSIDTQKTYKERLQQLLNDSSVAYKNAQKQAGQKGGYNLSENPEVPSLSQPNANVQQQTNPQVPANDNNFDVNNFLKNKFKNKDEFREAFRSYNENIQRQILQEMNRRGMK